MRKKVLKQLKDNWDSIIAFTLIWIAPLILVLCQGIQFYKNPNNNGKFVFEFSAIFVLGIILILYFKKIKKYLETKILVGMIKDKKKSPKLVLLNGLMTCLSITFAWLVCHVLEVFCSRVSDYLLIILIFEALGSILTFTHSLRMVENN